MEGSDSDCIDSDTEAYMYSQLHHNFPTHSTKNDHLTTNEQDVIANSIHEVDFPEICEEVTSLARKRTICEYVPKNKRVMRTVVFDHAEALTSEMERNLSQKFIISNETCSEKNQEATKNVEHVFLSENVIPLETNNSSASKVPAVTKKNKFCKPTIKITFNEELVPEKQNRKRPLVIKLSSSSKLVKSKNKVMKNNNKNSEDSSDSGGEYFKKLPQCEKSNVFINVDPSSVDFSEFGVENTGNALSMEEAMNQMDEPQVKQKKDGKMYIMCYNCRERGHLSKTCKKPKRVVNCFLCGQPGHKGDKCPNPVCSRCLLPGHWHYQCRWSPNHAPPCPLCHTKGHLCQQCPSIWRRCHLTTGDGPLVSTYKNVRKHQNQTCYCYNCGHEGHYGYDCKRNKRNKSAVPMNRVVRDYSDPRAILLHPVHRKLWRNMLKLASKAGSQISSDDCLMPVKRLKPSQKLQKVKRKRRKKNNARVRPANGGGDIVRIDPITEAGFPRSKKKTKLLAPFWKEVRRKASRNV